MWNAKIAAEDFQFHNWASANIKLLTNGQLTLTYPLLKRERSWNVTILFLIMLVPGYTFAMLLQLIA